jgi:Carboxypeptidase regulatory-like domain
MRQIAALLTLMILAAGSALADTTNAGLQGQVVDLSTGKPIAHATILYYKTPYLDNGPNRIITMKTDRNGYFTDITLQPGRYIVMARVPGKVEGCAVDDVQTGETARVKLEVGSNEIVCSGPRVHPTLVDPNLTADLYRI